MGFLEFPRFLEFLVFLGFPRFLEFLSSLGILEFWGSWPPGS